jgi:hypothetical protein
MKLQARSVLLLMIFTIGMSAIPIAAPTYGSGATAVVSRFYRWYLAQHGRVGEHFSQARAMFDPGLYALLQKAYQRNARGQLTLDFDPFANGQQLAGSYALGAPKVSGNMVQVPVTVGLAEVPHGKTHLVAVVKRSGSDYVIYNLVYDPTFNLRDTLSKALK